MKLDDKEAKEIIRAGFAWANWTKEQKEAFKLAYDAIDKVRRYEKALEFYAFEVASLNEDGTIAKKALGYIN